MQFSAVITKTILITLLTEVLFWFQNKLGSFSVFAINFKMNTEKKFKFKLI